MDNYEEVGKVYMTTDYDQFSLMKANRKLILNHVSNIANDMEKHFFITVALVESIDGILFIRDGQHRLTACRQADKPFYYCIINEIRTDVTKVNTETLSALQNTRKWLPSDYANFHAKQGHPEYEKFCNFQKETGFPGIASYVCLTGKIGVSMGGKFKFGYFKVEDEERAYVLAKIIQKFMTRGMGKSATNPKFVSSIYRGLMRETISLDKLYKRCEKGNWHNWIGGSLTMTLNNLTAASYSDRGVEKKDISIKNQEWPYNV